MAGIRTLKMDGLGGPSTKTYATPGRAAMAAGMAASNLLGMANVTIVPVEIARDEFRYTPVFSCFSETVDISRVAHAGFVCFR